MARQRKFSKNWIKAKARVRKVHQKIANVRRDFLHQVSTAISQNHAFVCIEDLNVRHMSKSATGTQAQPGKNVKAKSGLNRSILDQGWYEFWHQLQYKQAWRGGWLVAVVPQPQRPLPVLRPRRCRPPHQPGTLCVYRVRL